MGGSSYTVVHATGQQAPQYECTACLTTILGRPDAKKHRELGWIICKSCYLLYKENIRDRKKGEGFSLDKLGRQRRCRLCGMDQYLIFCTSNKNNKNTSSCRRAFCQSCVQRYDSEAPILRVYRNNPEQIDCHWDCFVCDTQKRTLLCEEAQKYFSALEAHYVKNSETLEPVDIETDDDEDILSEMDVYEEELPSVIASQQGLQAEASQPLQSMHEINGQPPPQQPPISVKSSYRDSNWSLVDHHIRDSKIDFRIKWDGFEDFVTSESVEFVLNDHLKVKSYLKLVRDKSFYDFDAMIKVEERLADVFKTSSSTSSLGGQLQTTAQKKSISGLPSQMEDATNSICQYNTQNVLNEIIPEPGLSTLREVLTGQPKDAILSNKTNSSSADLILKPSSNVILPVTQPQSDQTIGSNLKLPETNKPQKSSNNIECMTIEAQNTSTLSLTIITQEPQRKSPTSSTSHLSTSSTCPTAQSSNSAKDKSSAQTLGSQDSKRQENHKRPALEDAPQSPTKKRPNPEDHDTEEPNNLESAAKKSKCAPATNSKSTETPKSTPIDQSTLIRRDSATEPTILTKSTAKVVSTQFNNSSTSPNEPTKISDETKIIEHEKPINDRHSSMNQASPKNDHTKMHVPSSSAPSSEVNDTPVASASKDNTQSNAKVIIDSTHKADTNLDRKQVTNQNKTSQPAETSIPTHEAKKPICQENQNSTKSTSIPSNSERRSSTGNGRSAINLEDIMPIDRVQSDYKIPKLSGRSLQQKPSTTTSQQEKVTTTQTNSSSRKSSATSTVPDQSTGSNSLTDKVSRNSPETSTKVLNDSNTRPHGVNVHHTNQPTKRKSFDRETTSCSVNSTSKVENGKHSTEQVSNDASTGISGKTSSANVDHSSSSYTRQQTGEHESDRQSRVTVQKPSRESSSSKNNQDLRPKSYVSDTSYSRPPVFNRLGDQSSPRFHPISPDSSREEIRGHSSNYKRVRRPISPSIHSKNKIPVIVKKLFDNTEESRFSSDLTYLQQKQRYFQRSRLYKTKPAHIMVSVNAHPIKGSLKYFGMEAKHEAGIESIRQCARHKLTGTKEHKYYYLPVFEVKFWGHDEDDKLTFSEVVKNDFYCVKRFVRYIATHNKMRFNSWQANRSLEWRIYNAKEAEDCLRSILEFERNAYRKYLGID